MACLDKPRKAGVKDPRVASSPLKSHPREGAPGSNDCLGVTEPEVATVLPPDLRNAEKLEFDAISVVALLKKRN